MISLLISMLMLGQLNVFHNFLRLAADRIHNTSIEIVFDINKLDLNNARGHPDIAYAPPLHYPGEPLVFSTKGGYPVRFFLLGKQLDIGCPMYNTVYETLMCIGFTPEQILSAKRISTDVYEISTPARTYKAHLSRFEEYLGGPKFLHGRGYDTVVLYWDYENTPPD